VEVKDGAIHGSGNLRCSSRRRALYETFGTRVEMKNSTMAVNSGLYFPHDGPEPVDGRVTKPRSTAPTPIPFVPFVVTAWPRLPNNSSNPVKCVHLPNSKSANSKVRACRHASVLKATRRATSCTSTRFATNFQKKVTIAFQQHDPGSQVGRSQSRSHAHGI